jgi:hypothetical protein
VWQREEIAQEHAQMSKNLLALVAAAALGLSSTVALAQDAGFGGQGTNAKNQVPGPGVNKPTDPAAGNPGSAAQVPTAPEVQDDLYDSNSVGTADSTSPALTKPQTSSPN